MPTGYTAAIADGISFEKFVMDCARAFGALISMRDSSADAKIPEAFKPSDYHKKRIAETETKLVAVKRMSTKSLSASAKHDYTTEVGRIEQGIRKAENLREQYESMLSQVRAWQPPSSDHVGFKEFMEQQITSSIKFDCSTKYYCDQTPKLLSGNDWKAKRTAELLQDLAYNKEGHTKEIARVDGRNLWLKQLRESLKQ